MKKLLIVFITLAIAADIEAQSGNSGQIKTLIQQILLLKTYIGYLEKGYAIAKKGLNTISDIKNGDLHLHLDNFKSLKAINPAIKKYAKVADIISLQLQIVKVYKKTTAVINAGDLFTAQEIEYITHVFTKLLDQCTTTVDELIALTTSGNYEMKDDERLKRIDVIESDLQDMYSFANDFGQGAQIMFLQKNKTKTEVMTSRLLLNIKNP